MGLFDRLRGDDEAQVVFLGIDGVPYSLIDDHPEVFPNLHDLADAGTGAAIDSIVPPESSACWPSLTTGTNPGRTGVYGFQDRKVDSYETYVPMGAHVHGERVWDRVQAAGRQASVLNVPVTFPPDSTCQRMVSGFLSPSLEEATADEAFAETLEGFDYRIDVDAGLGHDADKTDFLEDAHETLAARRRAFEYVIDQDDWDLFFGVFMTTDRVNHFLFGDYATDGPYAEEFLDFYREVDDAIGSIRDRLDEDTHLVVASDHGFTHLEHEVNCNQFLAETGWLDLEADAEDLEDISPETEAYSLIPGRFYLNLEGREPEGAVPQAAYDERKRELRADLEGLTGPNGEPVAARVVDGEEVFEGPETEIAPDLVVIPNDGFDLKAGFSDKDAIFADGPRNGMHTFANATLISSADLDATTADLFDIAPTLLELLDIDTTGATFDGESLLEGEA